MAMEKENSKNALFSKSRPSNNPGHEGGRELFSMREESDFFYVDRTERKKRTSHKGRRYFIISVGG